MNKLTLIFIICVVIYVIFTLSMKIIISIHKKKLKKNYNILKPLNKNHIPKIIFQCYKSKENVPKYVFDNIKKRNPNLIIGVLGCMAQNLKNDLLKDKPYVDVILGPDSYRRIPELLNSRISSNHSSPSWPRSVLLVNKFLKSTISFWFDAP